MASAAPIFSEGEIAAVVVVSHDVTEQRRAEAALRESEEKLRTLFELMPIGISILDHERNVKRHNPALERILGLSGEPLDWGKYLARTYLRSDGTVMPPDEYPSARAWQEQKPVRAEVGVLKDDRTVIWTDVSAAPVPFADWKVVIATSDVSERRAAEAAVRRARDELEVRVWERTAELERTNQMRLAEIHERTRVERELRQSEQQLEQRVEERTRQLATLLEISTVALTIDLPPFLALILERLKDVVDYDGGAAFRLEAGILDPVFHRGAISPDDLLHIGCHLEEAVLGRAVVLGPEPMILADVQAEPALQEAFRQATGAKFADLARVVRAWMAVPVTMKQQAYGVLYVYHGQPARYTEEQARLALAFGNHAAVAIENTRLYRQAQELATLAERQHLARELHDAVSQTLFSASLAAEVLPRLWEEDRESGLECLGEVRQLTRAALAEMRTLLLELRPTTLAQADLAELLQQLAQAASSRTRIPVTVHADPHCPLPTNVRFALYRIAQEALSNMTKHAEARKADVTLRCTRIALRAGGGGPVSRVELSVADDGRGFDPRLPVQGNTGLGLLIMRERAEAVGAVLKITSAPGKGTHLAVTWPADDQ